MTTTTASIRANELRLGNVFKSRIRNHTVYCRILSITTNQTFCDVVYNSPESCLTDGYTGVWVKDLEPIRLTSELLEKCGFIKDADSDIYELDLGRKAFRIQLSTESIIYRCDIGMSYLDLNCDIEYLHLHQLQNLYFSLTNEEFDIKL